MRLAVLLVLLAAAGARPARAQADLTFRDTPLDEALFALSERTGVEVVFATRIVDGTRVTGRYSVADPDRTLRLLLRGTNLRAERLRAGQYVLIAIPPTVPTGVDDPKAYTGALEGRVVDAETGDGLGGAHVWLVDLGLGDVVDLGGAFLVPDLPAGRYTVRVSHVGYRPVLVELDVFPDSPQLPPTVLLRPEPLSAGTADVVAGPPDTGAAPGVTDVDGRSAATLPVALGEGDLAAALSFLPGLTRAGGASGPLVVRGADPGQTRIRRDGVPVHEPWHVFGALSAMQPETLSRVRFYRGALPVPLGGALAGVLDVETTDALAGDTTTTVAVSPLAIRAATDVALGANAGLHVGLRHSTLGAWLRPHLRAEPGPDGADGVWVLDPVGGRGTRAGVRFADAEAKLSLRLGDRVRLDAGGFGTADRLLVRPDAAGDVGFPSRLSARWLTGAASSRLRALVTDRTFVTAVGYHTRHASELARDADAVGQTLAETGLGLDVDHFLSVNHQIQAGGMVARRRLAPQAASDLQLYVVDTWTPSAPWQVQAGLRAEAVVAEGRTATSSLSPRLAVRWSPAEDRLTLRGAVGRQTQPLHRVTTPAGDRGTLAVAPWLLADRRVAPASLWQAGLGAEWAVSPRVALALDGYARRVHRLREVSGGAAVTRELPTDPTALAAAVPPLDGRAWGVEAAARVDVGAWTLGVTAARARADVRAPGSVRWQPAAFDRPWSAGLLAERRRGRLAGALRLDAESGRPRSDGRGAADLRATVAVGTAFRVAAVDWQLLAQGTWRLGAASGPWPAGAGRPLVVDGGALPGLPLVSLTGRW